MADLPTLEASEELSEPIEIYEFQIGSLPDERFTSADFPVVVDSETYERESITRTSVQIGIAKERRVVQIKMPAANSFASQWRLRPAGQEARVQVTRVQRNETPAIGTTQIVEYRGFLQTIDIDGDGQEAVLSFATREASHTQAIPRFTYSSLCNWFLFEPGCDVDPAAHMFTGTVTVEAGLSLTIPGLSVQPDGTYSGGYIRPTASIDFALILQHVGDVVVILAPMAESVLSAEVEVFEGCDHRIDGDCENQFSNVLEFGGFAFVPGRNIFTTGLK